MTLGDILSFIDSKKRVVGDSLSQLGSDPAEFLAQALARLKADTPARVTPTSGTLADIFHGVANPDAVLGSPVAGAGQAFSPLGLAGVMTYHGTPHKFDRYDLSKIGTGEGAQVYGHGMYFAENPQTANAYRTALAGTEVTTPAGKVMRTKDRTEFTPEHEAMKWVDMQMGGGAEFPIHTALLGAIQSGERPEVLDVLRKWNSGGAQAKQGGAVFKQDLPDEVLPRMLQWDKHFPQQSPAVQNAVSNIESPMIDAWRKSGAWPEHISGQTLYEQLVRDAGSNDEAIRRLSAMGIPGLSYLDAGSRNLSQRFIAQHPQGGQNAFNTKAEADAFIKRNPEFKPVYPDVTMNHVVWDQSLLDRMQPRAVE